MKADRRGARTLDELKAGMEALLEKEFSHLYPTEEARIRAVKNFMRGNGSGKNPYLFPRACPWKIEFFDDENRPDEKLKGVTIFMK